ncbi:hypothetical protein [Sulfitobacter sp. M39]|nr:hypothetical protein [Sulfitobacter sp. M39]
MRFLAKALWAPMALARRSGQTALLAQRDCAVPSKDHGKAQS